MNGGTDGNGGIWSASIALEASERQLALWKAVLLARYLATASAGLLALTPAAGEHGPIVAAIALLAVVPYNGFYDVLMRRTGRLPSAMAYTDQAIAVGLIALAPGLALPMLVVMLAISATTAVSFGRRIAGRSALLGAIGAGALLVARGPDGTPDADLALGTFMVFLLASAFIVVVVGLVSEVERSVRSRYAELMGGIDAVVWEQLTRSPSTLYVNRRAEEILGHPVAAWREPGFWGRTVHPEDRARAARAYREAIRRGENRELEYRMIAADGRVVHVHDHMRVETDGSGRVAHVRGVMLDVTEQRQTEARAQQYLNLVERIQVALFVFQLEDPEDDASLRLAAINPEAALVTEPTPRHR